LSFVANVDRRAFYVEKLANENALLPNPKSTQALIQRHGSPVLAKASLI